MSETAPKYAEWLESALRDVETNRWHDFTGQIDYWAQKLAEYGAPLEVIAAFRQQYLPAPSIGKLATTKREDILDTAKSLIVGDRQDSYGPPLQSFTRLAAAMNIVLEGAGYPPITPTLAAKLMLALKFSRLSGGDNKDDTWVDLAGYAALGAEVWQAERLS